MSTWVRAWLSNRKQRVLIGEYASDWLDVLSGVPQGSVLGPLLFVLFINDMPALVSHFCKLFADDTKLIAVIKNWEDVTNLQSDIDALTKWSQDWQMLFNEDKCKVMHFEKRKYNTLNVGFALSESALEFACEADPHNIHHRFTMPTASGGRHILEETTLERDLGVHLNNRLSWTDHISIIKASAYAELGKLKRTFFNWTIANFKVLYCTYVRPKLEFCASVWSPYNDDDVAAIEAVQRNATKLVPQIRTMPYASRLEAIGIMSLRDRRLRGDLIQYFKIANKINSVNWVNPNRMRPALSAEGPAGSVRGASHAIQRQIMKQCEPRDQFFSNRVVPFWNALPGDVIRSNSTNNFKNNLDKFIKSNSTFFTSILSTIADRS